MSQRQWTSERRWLRDLRGERTLRQVAEPHGFSTGALSGFEQGRGIPNLVTLRRLAAAYGMDPAAMQQRFLTEVDAYNEERSAGS